VALNQNDVALVAWICSQIAPYSVLGASPPLLSQHTLLSLLHHLGHDFSQVPNSLFLAIWNLHKRCLSANDSARRSSLASHM